MIQHPSRGSADGLMSAFHGGDLLLERLLSEYRYTGKLLVSSQCIVLVFDLQGQFSGRCQNQCIGITFLPGGSLQNGHEKGDGLPASGGGRAQDIFSGQGHRTHFLLYFCQFLETQTLNGLEDFAVYIETCKFSTHYYSLFSTAVILFFYFFVVRIFRKKIAHLT